jgi:gas vesicle structural protein
MAIERQPGSSSLIDVLDRVLDRGIVIDAWAQVSVAGLELITIDARVVVASIETYLKFSETFARSCRAAPPSLPDPEPTASLAMPSWLAEELQPGEPPPPVLWSGDG